MRRLPAIGFATLVVATVAAFFVSQHLKISDPLINGSPRPDPPAINPVAGRVCKDLAGRRVSFRRTRIGFYLQSRADTVLVDVVDAAGQFVATAGGSGRYVRPGPRRYVFFTWDGRQSDGTVAPDGTYFFRVALQQEGRTFELTNAPVRVITTDPHPAITQVTLSGHPVSDAPAIVAPPADPVTIRYRPGRYHNADIQILRTDLPGRPVVVKSFGVNGRRGKATWNGLVAGVPASAGTYLVGMTVTDQACNPGRFPVVLPPPPGTTRHAGVTVRYLAAEPPLVPTPAGSPATVYVDSRRRTYSWALRRPGEQRVIEQGAVSRAAAASGRGVTLRIRMPPQGAGVYRLALHSGSHRTVVPVIASAAGRRAAVRILVVLPALTWQGENPVDDDGSGLPDTLGGGDRIDLQRPLVTGLPADFVDVTSLLAYLDARKLPFQLTTDLALAQHVGPSLAGHTGVLLDGGFTWLPAGLGAELRAFAAGGGRVLSIGLHSLQATAPLQHAAGSGGPATAGPSQNLSPDPFGATHGPPTPSSGQLIAVIRDPLGLFRTTSGAFAGFGGFQPISPPPGIPASLAGTTDNDSSVTGFRLGHGTVIEVGLPRFGERLGAGDVDVRALLGRAWQILLGH